MSTTTATASTNTSTAFPVGALYVGDLHPDVNEATLYDKFSTAGPLLSLHVCRDLMSRRSLGYAYVNYHTPTDAERALDTMNFDIVKGRPIRIMWSQRDPSLRKSGIGNVFIKNLDKKIDNKAMYDTFSAFGNILSCKVALDEVGQSKGYGFVHFETEESAYKAIIKVNGMLLNGKKVYVGKFVSRSEREKLLGDKAKIFYNVYIKNFANELDEKALTDMFDKFGPITSLKIMCSDDGTSKGFGFVAFEKYQSAEKAVDELNGREIKEGVNLYVGRAQKKSERQLELKKRYEQIKNERYTVSHGTNLYIKNLDDSINDEKLRKEFENYGTISSVKVMMENDRSKGFGFVCYSTPEEATKAVTEMNGKIVGTKPLYVALAQRKDERKALLTAHYVQRVMSMRSQYNNYANNNNYYNMQHLSTQRFFTPPFIPQIRSYQAPRWPIPQQIRASQPGAAFATLQNSYRLITPARIGGNHGSQPNMRSVLARPITGQQTPGGPRQRNNRDNSNTSNNRGQPLHVSFQVFIHSNSQYLSSALPFSFSVC